MDEQCFKFKGTSLVSGCLQCITTMMHSSYSEFVKVMVNAGSIMCPTLILSYILLYIEDVYAIRGISF